MDKQTIQSYNQDAKNIAQLHSTLIPEGIYNLVDQFFIKGGKSIDIGCGIGRDTRWLNQNGYPCIGVDASIEMLNEAAILYPAEQFSQDSLPSLNSLSTSSFQNILCSAVLMHIPQENLVGTYEKILDILNKKGILILSFRSSNEPGNREKGKLYEPINAKQLINYFEHIGCEILLKESETEVKRNLTWHNIVIKK